MTFWQVAYSFGLFFAFWTNYACTKYKSRLPENWDWKIVCIFQLMVVRTSLGTHGFVVKNSAPTLSRSFETPQDRLYANSCFG